MTSEGLIVYVPGSNGVDFMRLEMVNQKLILEWNLGSGIGKVESNPVQLGKWISIAVKRKDLDAKLTVDDGDEERIYTGKSKARFISEYKYNFIFIQISYSSLPS